MTIYTVLLQCWHFRNVRTFLGTNLKLNWCNCFIFMSAENIQVSIASSLLFFKVQRLEEEKEDTLFVLAALVMDMLQDNHVAIVYLGSCDVTLIL